jgi:hypothetical protein
MIDRPSQLSGEFTPHDVVMALAAEPCGIVYGNKPDRWTCLDEWYDLQKHPEKYGEPLKSRIGERRELCWSCAAVDALNRSPYRLPERNAR